MKLSSLKNVFGIKSAEVAMPVAKKTAVSVTKPVAKQASGAEALANQGRAMVRRPYQKPEVEVIKMEDPKSLRACSTPDHGSGEPVPSFPEEEANSAGSSYNSSSFWD